MGEDGGEVCDEAARDERVVPEVPARESLQRRDLPDGEDGDVDSDDAKARPLGLAQVDVVLRDDRGPAPPGPKVPHELARAGEHVLRPRDGQTRLDAAPRSRHRRQRAQPPLRVRVGKRERGREPCGAEADAKEDVRQHRRWSYWRCIRARSGGRWFGWAQGSRPEERGGGTQLQCGEAGSREHCKSDRKL